MITFVHRLGSHESYTLYNAVSLVNYYDLFQLTNFIQYLLVISFPFPTPPRSSPPLYLPHFMFFLSLITSKQNKNKMNTNKLKTEKTMKQKIHKQNTIKSEQKL